MIVDTSAFMAIVMDEPEREIFADALASDIAPVIATGTWVELAAVGTRRFEGGIFQELDALMKSAGIVIVATTPSQAQIAHDAYRRYGIGSGHPAKLNIGDCFSYALAKERGEPLLFKGDDFVYTDIERAV